MPIRARQRNFIVSRSVTLKASKFCADERDPERDIQFTLRPIDSLDQASRLPNLGSIMGIDATRKWPAEGFTRPWPEEIKMDAKTRSQVDAKWSALKGVRGFSRKCDSFCWIGRSR